MTSTCTTGLRDLDIFFVSLVQSGQECISLGVLPVAKEAGSGKRRKVKTGFHGRQGKKKNKLVDPPLYLPARSHQFKTFIGICIDRQHNHLWPPSRTAALVIYTGFSCRLLFSSG